MADSGNPRRGAAPGAGGGPAGRAQPRVPRRGAGELSRSYPEILTRAGLDARTLEQVDLRLVGCGGFVRELIAYTAGTSSVKDDSGQRLSAADVLVDELLREELLRLVPESSGFSEEGGEFGRESTGLRVRWLLDPLDGTRVATLGGAFAVCAGALVLDGRDAAAAVGWVYVPTLGMLYRGVLAPGFQQCLRGGKPARAECDLSPAELPRRYLAVSSDWQSAPLPRSPLKLTAPGATAVHLTQLVQPGSDVAGVALTRYRSYDAAAGLAVAAAGGCAVYRVEDGGRPAPAPSEPLAFLRELDLRPREYGPRALVCVPAVADALRG